MSGSQAVNERVGLPTSHTYFQVDVFLIDPAWLNGEEPHWLTIQSELTHERAREIARYWLSERPEMFTKARISEIVTTVATRELEVLP